MGIQYSGNSYMQYAVYNLSELLKTEQTMGPHELHNAHRQSSEEISICTA